MRLARIAALGSMPIVAAAGIAALVAQPAAAAPADCRPSSFYFGATVTCYETDNYRVTATCGTIDTFSTDGSGRYETAGPVVRAGEQSLVLCLPLINGPAAPPVHAWDVAVVE